MEDGKHSRGVSTRLRLWCGKLRQRRLPVGVNLALAAFTVCVLVLLANQPPRIVFPTLRGYPRSHFRQHWVRIVFPFQDAAETQRKAALPRFRMPRDDSTSSALPFPVRVISLANATERRASVERQLKERGIAFDWFDAVDGRKEGLPDDEVQWHSSGAKRKGIYSTGPGSFYRRHIADDLSHFRAMHLMIAEGRDMQLVFEDDFQLVDEGDDWVQRLAAAMQQLPEDWEIFWLNHGKPIIEDPDNLLGFVGRGVRRFAENSGMLSYVYRRSFALRALNDAQIGDKDIDDLLNDLGALGDVAAYVADPPLVCPSKLHEQSQIALPGTAKAKDRLAGYCGVPP